MSLPYSTICALQAAFARSELSPKELLQHCLATSGRYEPDVQAWVSYQPETALASADELQKVAPADRGPLWGIPVGIKDIIDVAGYPSYCGSAMLRKYGTPTIAVGSEAPVVAKLRQAGAIILGKTATTEFACFDPAPTSNPWNLTHTPGGSSSGTAAAVASGMCLAALGTQTGGSILRPASYCGVVGYKPAHGSLPMEGIFPVSTRLDHVGPFTASVKDAYLVQQCLLGAACVANSVASNIKGVRLGVLREIYESSLDPTNAPFFAAAIDQLQDAGAQVSSCLPRWDWGAIRKVHRQIMAFDAWKVHHQHWPDRIGELGMTLQGLLHEGEMLSREGAATDQLLTQQQAAIAQRMMEAFSQYDAVLLPSTPAPAPATKTTTGDPQYNSPFSLAGLPAITIPYAISDQGMPLGIQLVSCREASLWPAAIAVESALGVESFAAKHCPRR